MTIETPEQARAKANALRQFLAANGCSLGLRKTLDAVAVMEGLPNWNTLSARLKARPARQQVAAAISSEAPKLPSALARLFTRLTNSRTNSIEAEGLDYNLRHPGDMPQWVYLQLQALSETMDLAVAQGQDATPNFDEDRHALDRLMEAAPWTMHPDWGCVPKARLDASGRLVTFEVPVTTDIDANGRQEWYFVLSAEGQQLKQMTGPYADVLDLVAALDERFDDLGIPYELNWQAGQLPTSGRCSVCQDNGAYHDGLPAPDAVALAKGMRDSGAGGVWTVEARTGRVVAVFR